MRADAARGEAAQFLDALDRLFDPVVADGAGAVGVDIEGERLGNADGVGELDGAALRETGGDDVLREVAGELGGRWVGPRGRAEWRERGGHGREMWGGSV